MINELKFYLSRPEYLDNKVYVRFGRKNVGGGWHVAQPVEFKLAAAGELHKEAISLENSEAQSLMDALWDVGIRPTQGAGSAGSMAATQQHLNDMRAIVSKKIGVELK